MIYNHIIVHDMDAVSFFPPSLLSDFGKDSLNLIQVWEFPEYLRLSLPSGLCCVMSYLMQPDKQYACTDSIKETEWGTHTGGLYVHSHTHTEDLYILAGFITHNPHSAALFGQKPSTPAHTCSATHDFACRALKKKISPQTSVFTKSPIRCVTCCLVTCTLWLNHQICKVMTSITAFQL